MQSTAKVIEKIKDNRVKKACDMHAVKSYYILPFLSFTFLVSARDFHRCSDKQVQQVHSKVKTWTERK